MLFIQIKLWRLINFTKFTGINNQWQAEVLIDPDAEIDTNTIIDIGGINNATNIFTLEFDNFGAILQALDGAGDVVDTGLLQVQASFDVQDSTPDLAGALIRQTLNLNLGTVGSMINSMTQFAESSSTKACPFA